jgi:Asp-tRNA(Asn)/Glu-tRNA(Gln) amidotransferase A subunit family amidase
MLLMTDGQAGPTDDRRRAFLACFAGTGLATTLMPGVLWARLQDGAVQRITPDMVREAARVAGLELTDAEQQGMLEPLNRILSVAGDLHREPPVNSAPSPIHFDPRVPGEPLVPPPARFRTSRPSRVSRPARLDDLAFWPITHLAELIRTRTVSCVELAELYLARLERYNPALNCVVTLTRERALEQARALDLEIAANHYRGLLHGIPWGVKDIVSARGYPTTWGAAPFDTRVIDLDATVVQRLTDAGAVLVAKLSSGELAFGDQWHRGRTNNPWDASEGSSGSSAGSGAAPAAGLVGFAVGTDTGGSILSPAVRCGIVGLRPTFGRVSRYGVMAAGWTLDKIGPMCRTVEDCAIVLNAMAGADGRDLSVREGIPVGWDGTVPPARLRVGYVPAMVEADTDPEARNSHTRAYEALAAAGMTLEPIEVPASNLTYFIEYTERAAGFEDFVRSGQDAGLLRRRHSAELRAYHLVTAVDYLQANRVRARLMAEYARVTHDVDVVLGGRVTLDAKTSLNPVTSLTGHPAVAVPNGFTARGTPAGMVLVGRLYQEAALLSVARVLERATGLQGRRPTIG